MATYVVGHKNPDTDSIISAIAYSELEKTRGREVIPARPGEINKESAYVLEKFNFEIPIFIPQESGKSVILVDHNEPSQTIEVVKSEEVIAIIDHHKLGGLSTPGPISMLVKPVGCTATIIGDLFYSENHEISPNLAGLLISGIVSDTLKFTSPSTTEEDKIMFERLNKIANVNVDELATAMFKAKSDISDIKTEELIGKDYKVYKIAGKTIGFGVWETVMPESILERKNELVDNLKSKKESEELDLIYFADVDIINKETYLFVIDSAEFRLANNAYQNEKINENLLKLSKVVSRKKDMIPPLEKALI